MTHRPIQILVAFALSLAQVVQAFDASIPAGSTTKTVSFRAVQSSDHISGFTGGSSFTVYYSLDGGTPTAMTTPTVTELNSTNMPGWYKLLIDEAPMTVVPSGQDKATLDLHITHANMDPKVVKVEVYELMATVSEIQSGLGTAENQATIIGYIDTEVAAIKAKTDNLPASPAAVGDIPTAVQNAVAVVDLSLSGHTTTGTVGKALSDAAAGGDPWTVTASGYSSGTFGYILSNTTTSDELDDIITGNAIIAKLDALEAKLTSMIQLDGSDYKWTQTALEESPVSVSLTQQDIQTIAAAAQPQTLATTVAAGGATKSSFGIVNGPSTDGYFGGRYWFAVVIDATTEIPGGGIIGMYTGATKTVTLETELPFTPQVGDAVYIMPMAGQAKWSR